MSSRFRRACRNRRRFGAIWLAVSVAAVCGTASAHQGFSFGGPDGHAPAGVMADHYHKQGELMISYRYMRMEMNGNRIGTDDVSAGEVIDPAGEGFMVTPLDMWTEMHMFGAMYAVNDTVTLMGMLPYVIKEMDHRTRMGEYFTTRSEGVGDVTAGALVRLFESNSRALHLTLGLSLPTGSIDEEDDTPRCRIMGNCPAQLPYPMQLGSGTFDPIVGLTWRGDHRTWSWGTQATATFRLGRNAHGYSQGDKLEVTAWAAKPLLEQLSLSARVTGSDVGNYDGQDEELEVANSNFIPTAESDLRGGTRAQAAVGLNWAAGDGPLFGHRLAFEWIEPVYQDLDGPQLEDDGMLMLAWQYTRY